MFHALAGKPGIAGWLLSNIKRGDQLLNSEASFDWLQRLIPVSALMPRQRSPLADAESVLFPECQPS